MITVEKSSFEIRRETIINELGLRWSIREIQLSGKKSLVYLKFSPSGSGKNTLTDKVIDKTNE